MIKLIVSDIDGTLLPYGASALDERLFQLIHRLAERGVIFAPASGRQYHSLRALFAPVCDELAYLCENGCIVYGPGPEQIHSINDSLFHSPLRCNKFRFHLLFD